MFPASRPQLSNRLATGLLVVSALVAACASRQPQASSPTSGAAIVHNSIHIGLIKTTFFVVDSVDGTRVHEKMDFKRHVELAAGRHELTVTHYTDALWGSRDSTETCAIIVEVEPNGSYRVEGEARHGEWRARLVDGRTGREFPCIFADDAGPGAAQAEIENREATTPPAVIAGGASSSGEPSAVGAARVKGRDAAAADAVAVTSSGRTSRHRSFCGRGFYRVGHWEGDATFVLERSDRVRLIGVQPDTPGRPSGPADVMGIEGKCVHFDYEPTNLIDGHRDRDGRLLAYVYLDDGTFVNLELIRQGRVRASDERHRHLAEFLAAQSMARKERIGIWAPEQGSQ